MLIERQEAKIRVSGLVRRTRKEGPQVVTSPGRRVAIVLSAKTYNAPRAKRASIADHSLFGPASPEDSQASGARTREPQ
jgi:prevent-host-death family protein